MRNILYKGISLFIAVSSVMPVWAQDRHFESCPLEVINKGWSNVRMSSLMTGVAMAVLCSIRSPGTA